MTAPILGPQIGIVASLPSAGYIGQVVIVSSNGHLYNWDGATWIDNGSSGGGGGATAREIRLGVFYAP